MFRKLTVYQKAFSNAKKVFEYSKQFPAEERYSLTDQIRRSSRSVCANIAEAYRKRQYQKHFISKLSDADSENSETLVWLEFAFEFGYRNKSVYNELVNEIEETGRLINYMISNPSKYKIKAS